MILLTIFTILTFVITLTLTTLAIFMTLSTARLMRLQQVEAYAIQHSHTLSAHQLSFYLHSIELTPASIRATQEMRKTQPLPPPAWIRKKTAETKTVIGDVVETQEISNIKAS